MAQQPQNFWLAVPQLLLYNSGPTVRFSMIQQELRSPIKIFKVQEDGSETVELKPPTSLMLRAANHIDQLIKTIEVLQIELNNIKGGVQ